MLDIAFVLDVLLFSILAIVWFLLSAFLFRGPEDNRVPLEKSREDHKTKSDFIDKQLLKAINYTINDDIILGHQYIIHGKVFQESIKRTTYKEFELYKLKMDDYADADTSGVSIDDDTPLHVTLELVPNGFIINSNVFLTHQQWHTIYPVSEDVRRCAVCDVYCDVADHIGCSKHVENMQRYKPLNKFDLSITRWIKNNYHCGVCNTLFDQAQKNEHYSSKTHENKLLFAINRVSDIMYDFNIHNNNNNEKKDSYYFNTKHDTQESYMLDEPIDDDLDDDGDDDGDDDEWYPCYKEDYEQSDEEFYEEPVQNLEFSYASMAKKPKNDDLPEVLEVDLGNKKVTVKFNSWNMLIRPMANRFYCMACKELDHIRKRGEHCKSEGHMARLDACHVVDEYEKFFVRQVDDKCYHCGHCNNLQLIDVMEDHIGSVHTHPTTVQSLLDSPTKKISSPLKTNPAKTVNDKPQESQAKNEIANDDKNKYALASKEAEYVVINPALVFEGLKAANSNFDDIVIYTFGSNICISKLAFNIICQGQNDFYCGLCEVSIVKELLRYHLNDVRHLHLMLRTPFILAFNVHLFRQIRDALHCGICNELIQIMPEFIIKHKYLEKHIVNLHRALRDIKNDNTAIQNNFTKDSGIIDKPKPLEPIAPKNVTTSDATCKNNIPNAAQADNITVNTIKETANKINYVPASNANTKIVPVNKNISITTVNSNKNESANTNINKNNVATKNVQGNNGNKNEINKHNVATKNMQGNNGNKNESATTNIYKNNVATKNVQDNNGNKNESAATNINKNNVATKNVQVNNGNKNESATTNINKHNVATKNVQGNIKNGALVNEKANDNIKIETDVKREEFIIVKNGVKEQEDDLDDSYIDDFDPEEYVYIKLGNSYIKITNTSYNTLVDVGDGTKYCFVCSSVVCELSKHIESRGHMENMEKVKFVDKYSGDLLRQSYLVYHCGICNVVITRKQLNHHLSWPTHTLQTENTKISSKKRKTEIKTGTKQMTVPTQKENIYLNEKEPDIKIFLHINIEKENEFERMNKIVIFNDNVLKVHFDFWNGLSEGSDGYRCKMCQCDFEANELGRHVADEYHKANLENIEKKYSPALIRKINDATLNCIICNTEVSNKKHIVTEHIQGKKHIKNYETMLKESSVAYSYTDCDQDVVML